MAEAGLCVEQPLLVHQVAGHAFTKTMQRRMLDARRLPARDRPLLDAVDGRWLRPGGPQRR